MQIPKWANTLVGLVSNLHVIVFRLTRGWIGGKWGRCPICLLTTRGRKSYRMITRPLIYLPDGERYYVVASYGGRDQPPAWWLNLQANPRGRLEIRGRTVDVEAMEASPEVHDRMWPRFVQISPDFEKYQRSTTRRIPIVELSAV